MIALALKALGLMRVSEHEAEVGRLEESIASREREIDHIVSERNEAIAKFKRAATDLAAQAEEIAAYKEGAKALHRGLDEYMAEIKNLKNMLESEIANSRLVEADNAELKASFNQRLADAVQDYERDAQKWRNYLKRSRDRKAGKSNG